MVMILFIDFVCTLGYYASIIPLQVNRWNSRFLYLQFSVNYLRNNNDYLQLDILCGSIGNYCICCPIYKKGDELYDETCPVFHTTRHLMRFLLSFILQKRICVTSYVRHLCQQIIPLPYLQSACQDLLHRGRDQIHLSCCIESSNMPNLDWVPQSLMEQ